MTDKPKLNLFNNFVDNYWILLKKIQPVGISLIDNNCSYWSVMRYYAYMF